MRSARDKRGYDTLYVMHAFETGREGRPRPRVLYAFRSVPYARVGRAALDESVQRRIEAAYPQLQFDWPRLLKEAAASAPRPEKPKGRAKEKKRKVPQVPRVPLVPEVRFQQPTGEAEHQAPIAAPPAALDSGSGLEPELELEQEPRTEPPEPTEPEEPMEPGSGSVPGSDSVPLPGPLFVDPTWPAVAVTGDSRTLILRGRYIELAHRVMSRVEDQAARRRLLIEAARLNPETWRTSDEARRAIEGFDAAYDALAAKLRQRPGEESV